MLPNYAPKGEIHFNAFLRDQPVFFCTCVFKSVKHRAMCRYVLNIVFISYSVRLL